MDCIDPVTKDTLDDPFLASDGETYSRDTLLQCVRTDPWHRSPVTYEVLRGAAYRNVFIATLLGASVTTPDTLHLFDDEDAAAASAALPDGRTITWTVPALLPARDTMVRRRFGLPDEAFTVTAVVRRDSGNLDWLMYPPAAQEMWADIVALASVVGADKATANPWCLTFARLQTGRTVEAQWLLARRLEEESGR